MKRDSVPVVSKRRVKVVFQGAEGVEGVPDQEVRGFHIGMSHRPNGVRCRVAYIECDRATENVCERGRECVRVKERERQRQR